MRNGERAGRWAVLLLGWALFASTAAADDVSVDDALAMEIEDLLELDITIMKLEMRLGDTPAAVTVLTAQEIRRAGHTTLAESLRLVPGFHVASIDGNKWSVSARGFAGRFTDKLLVMIDGRSVYTPLFGGVFWDVQDVFLPDLDRVEAIRGPGASLWGANAVNGVVNVQTKAPRDTQGLVVQGGGGIGETGFLGARYGGRRGDVWYRGTLHGFLRSDQATAAGDDATDEWHQIRGTLRGDWEASSTDTLSVEGSIYGGRSGERSVVPTLTAPFASVSDEEQEVAGGHFLARWTRRFGSGEEWEAKLSYDRTERDAVILDEERDTFELDFARCTRLGARHHVVWGAGYRVSRDDVGNTFAISMTPDSATEHMFQAFLQDEIAIVPGKFTVTVGTRLEYGDDEDLEVQPNVRALWRPNDDHTLWAAFSRAVTSPARAQRSSRINVAVQDQGGTPVVTSFFGNRNLDAEELLATELGWRMRVRSGLTLDVAAFYSVYDDLQAVVLGAPFGEAQPPPSHQVVPGTFQSAGTGESYGFEVATRWQALEGLRIDTGYAFARTQLHIDPSLTAPTFEPEERQYPRHQAFLRAAWDPAERWRADFGLYYVDALPAIGVPAHVRVDLRLAYLPDDRTSIELIVRNLVDDRHPEFVAELPFNPSTEVETAVFLRFTRTW